MTPPEEERRYFSTQGLVRKAFLVVDRLARCIEPMIPAGLRRPLLLAGGITPDNVHDAIRATSPWAVDVASGIEVAPGVKDGEKMRRFVAEVRRADGTGPD